MTLEQMLMEEVKKRDADITKVTALIGQGADVNEEDALSQRTPLMQAVSWGRKDIARALIDAGASVTHRSDGGRGHSALDCAATVGDIEVITLLLDNGADVNGQGSYGFFPLFYAAFNMREAAVRLLLDRGADPEHPTIRTSVPAWLEYPEQHTIAVMILGEPEHRKAEAERLAKEQERIEKERQENVIWCAAGCPLKEDLKLMKPAQIRRKPPAPH